MRKVLAGLGLSRFTHVLAREEVTFQAIQENGVATLGAFFPHVPLHCMRQIWRCCKDPELLAETVARAQTGESASVRPSVASSSARPSGDAAPARADWQDIPTINAKSDASLSSDSRLEPQMAKLGDKFHYQLPASSWSRISRSDPIGASQRLFAMTVREVEMLPFNAGKRDASVFA